MNNIRTIFSADSLDSPLVVGGCHIDRQIDLRIQIAKNLFLDTGDLVAELLSDKIRQSKGDPEEVGHYFG